MFRRARAPRVPRASRMETVGAWLGIWTPPRDVLVPPPPSARTLALAGVALAAAVAAGAFAALPALERTRARQAAVEAREEADRRAAARARQEAEQRPRRGAARAATREGVMARVRTAIGADARRRFDSDARAATCRVSPGQDPRARRVAFDCLSAVRDIVGGGEQRGVRGTLGIPFRAVVDFGSGRYAFCKVNPPPGELALLHPKDAVALPAACRRPER